MIIFVGVSFFVLQIIYFIHLYGTNWPNSGDAYLVSNFNKNKIELPQNLLENFNSHIHLFPRLIIFSSAVLDSLNFVHLMFVGLAFCIFTTMILYLSLKRIEPRLTWLLIPIAAFLFSPLKHYIFLYALASLAWEIAIFCIVSVFYLFNREEITKKTFLTSISLAVIASFSLVLGLLIWLVGSLSLLSRFKREKRWLIFWALSGFMTFLMYFTIVKPAYSEKPSALFSLNELIYVITYITDPFRLKFGPLILIVGATTLILFVILSWFLLKNKIKKGTVIFLAQFLIIGILSALVSAIGRIQDISQLLHGGITPYYAAIANLPQISLLILVGLALLKIRNNTEIRHKKFCSIAIIILIVIQVSMLSPSYYLGWKFGREFYNLNSSNELCYWPNTFQPTKQCVSLFENTGLNEIMNFLLANKFAIFDEKDFQNKHTNVIISLSAEYNSLQSQSKFGKIETINSIEVSQTNMINVNESAINIKGWLLDENKKQLDEIILLIDHKPFMRQTLLEERKDIAGKLGEKTDLYSGWDASFLSGFIDGGCHTITVGGKKDNKIIMLDQEIKLCKV